MEEDPIGYDGDNSNLYEYESSRTPNVTDAGGLKVQLRCYEIRAGKMHCGVIVTCNGKEVSYDGGGANFVSTEGTPGPARPTPERNPPLDGEGARARHKPKEVLYDVNSQFKNCEDELKCLDCQFKNQKQAPYNAAGPNSNTYAHMLLARCGMTMKPIKKERVYGNGIYDTITVTDPPNAPGWSTTGYYGYDEWYINYFEGGVY